MSNNNEPLPLETYAMALAHLLRRRGEPVADVLASLDIPPEVFSAAERHWTAALAESLTRRRGAMAMGFASAWAQAQQKVGLLDPAGGAPEPARVGSSAAMPARTDLPSFLRAEPEPSAQPPVPLGETPGSPVPSGESPPAPVQPAAPVAPPPLVHVERAGRAPLAGTGNLDVGAILAGLKQGALPFARTASPAVAEPFRDGPASGPKPRAPAEPSEPRPASSPGSRPVRTGTGTLTAIMGTPGIGDRGLPFLRLGAVAQGPAEVVHDEATVDAPLPQPPAPAEPGDDHDVSRLPLETYASVSMALARGEPREAVLARYSLTPLSFDTLARSWAQRFAQEPHLLERYKELARSGAARGKAGEGQR